MGVIINKGHIDWRSSREPFLLETLIEKKIYKKWLKCTNIHIFHFLITMDRERKHIHDGCILIVKINISITITEHKEVYGIQSGCQQMT